jgi:predicted nucleic acid-binding protein
VTGLTLDAGALVGLERRDPRVTAVLDRADRLGWPIHVPAGVVAQTWRGGPRQALVAKLLHAASTTIVPLDPATAFTVGLVCGSSGHPDVVDVHVAVHAAAHGHRVVTSDPDDIARVDPNLPLVVV